MRMIVTLLVAVALVGCAVKVEEESEPKKKSTAQTAIEGATGKTAVDALKKARQTTEDAAGKRNADIDAAMEE